MPVVVIEAELLFCMKALAAPFDKTTLSAANKMGLPLSSIPIEPPPVVRLTLVAKSLPGRPLLRISEEAPVAVKLICEAVEAELFTSLFIVMLPVAERSNTPLEPTLEASICTPPALLNRTSEPPAFAAKIGVCIASGLAVLVPYILPLVLERFNTVLLFLTVPAPEISPPADSVPPAELLKLIAPPMVAVVPTVTPVLLVLSVPFTNAEPVYVRFTDELAVTLAGRFKLEKFVDGTLMAAMLKLPAEAKPVPTVVPLNVRGCNPVVAT